MFLKKILKLKNTLLFRLTALYTLAFVAVSLVSFLIFYFYVYSVSMERMDDELQDDVEVFAAVMARESLPGVKAKIAETAESEDPKEEFYRLMNINGDILATTDMSAWGTVTAKDALAKLSNSEDEYIAQTINVTNDDDDFEARLITAVIGPGTVLQIGETLEENRYISAGKGNHLCRPGCNWRLHDGGERHQPDRHSRARQALRAEYRRRTVRCAGEPTSRLIHLEKVDCVKAFPIIIDI